MTLEAPPKTITISFHALVIAATLACHASSRVITTTDAEIETERWWKGNTHTHSLWSDGDDFPEMIADWYRKAGYQFLAITDHNLATPDTQWWPVPAQGLGARAYRQYRDRFGAWVDTRQRGETLSVRLRTTSEYRRFFDHPSRFLVVDGEEITQYLDKRGAHMNALNLTATIPSQPGATLVEMLRNDLAAARAQELETKRPIVVVLNHPNFLWSQTAEDMLALADLSFFEVYNGHPLVNVRGDTLRPGNERLWDIVLTRRLGHDRAAPMLFGVATDDAHDFHEFAPAQRNPGRGWIMVRAAHLIADELMAAMKAGDFYASTGVELTEVRRYGKRLSIRIAGRSDATYTTQFIGTRASYDTANTAVSDSAGRPVTRRYSRGVGEVLAEVRGLAPAYTLRGDELYVRARVVSSRQKTNASYTGEREMAWTQPVRP
jgi:hypothetical protein